MRRFWWLFGLLFICSLVLYTVGTGWITATTVVSDVRHGRRQLEAEKIVADMAAAQQALVQHRDRVLAFGFAFPEPDFRNTRATYQQIEQLRQQFQAFVATQDAEAAPTQQYMAATERLKAYRVSSLSVMPPGMQTALGTITLVLGILALLLTGVRFLSSE